MSRTYVWIALVGVALAAVAALLWLPPGPKTTVIELARDPWVVGDAEDPFSYAGDVHSVSGTATLIHDAAGSSSMLVIKLSPDETVQSALSIPSATHEIGLLFEFDDTTNLWLDQRAYGESSLGDSRLPSTHVDVAGAGPFSLQLDGKDQDGAWYGFWSIGDALRRSDGAVRNQGLIFTPLLRDQSGFSDPSRSELTLLLYETAASEQVILDLVFPNVEVDVSGLF